VPRRRGDDDTEVRLHAPTSSLRVTLLALLLATFLAVPPVRRTTTMATTGSDSNPCTLAAPCATVDRASGRLASGDTLYIRGGSYGTSSFPSGYENWHLPAGTAAQPTTIRNYPGEAPVFRRRHDPGRVS